MWHEGDRGLSVDTGCTFGGRDPHLVGQCPAIAHRDGDGELLHPDATRGGDGRRPGEHIGGGDVGDAVGQGVGNDGGEGHVAGVGDAEGVGQLCPGRHRVGAGLFGHCQCGWKLIGANVVIITNRS